jgi:hypothetical protein
VNPSKNGSVESVLVEVRDRAISLGGPLLAPAPSSPAGEIAGLAGLVDDLGGSDAAAFAIEAVREGFLCHHDSSRLLDLADEDLALLAGDLLYAIALRELAIAGEVESVAVLADLIRLVSARAEDGTEPVMEVLWLGQATALGVGSDDRHRAAIEAIESGEDPVAGRLSDWAREAIEAAEAGEALSGVAQALQ